MGYVYYNDPVGVGRAVEQFTRAATDTVASLLTLRTTLLPANLDATTAIYVGMGLAACGLALVGWSRLRRRSSRADRARGPAATAPKPRAMVRFRRPVDWRSRPQRWRDAVAELVELQADYAAWLDALPDSLRGSATAEALRTIADFDLSELEALEPGRD